jgi:hypothetical protein
MENTPKDTILKKLTIERNSGYEPNPGQYKGEVEFQTRGANMCIQLDESISQNLLAYLGPVLVQASGALAQKITGCLETSLGAATEAKAIEAKSQSQGETPDSPV